MQQIQSLNKEFLMYRLTEGTAFEVIKPKLQVSVGKDQRRLLITR